MQNRLAPFDLFRQFALFLIAFALFSATGHAANLENISAPSSDPASRTGAGNSAGPIISANGRFILFSSSTPGLLSNQIGGRALNLYLRDRQTGSLTLVSASDAAVAGESYSIPGGITPDGRYVVFASPAGNLVGNDTNGYSDIFLRDLTAGTTRLISANVAGTGSGNSASTDPAITPDGKYVVFQSIASNLINGYTNLQGDIFLRDVTAGNTEWISISTIPGAQTTCSAPVITPDGRYVAFIGTGTNLVTGVGASTRIYVRDRLNQITLWASKDALNFLANDAGTNSSATSYNPSISDDGRFVFFKSTFAGNAGILRFETATGNTKLLGNAAPFTVFTQDDSGPAITSDGQFAVFAGTTNLYRWDLTSDSLISLAEAPRTNSNGAWWSGFQITSDGRWIAFASQSGAGSFSNISDNWQVYLADASAKTNRLITTGTSGSSGPPQISLSVDGTLIAYDSSDGSLVEGDHNENLDVFAEPLPSGARELISSVPTGKGEVPLGSLALSLNGVSGDGRLVLFSTSRQLSALDTNRAQDVYVHDLDAKTNRLISVHSEGEAEDGWKAFNPGISSNGTKVVFVSRSSNFAANDTNGVEDVFVRDLNANTTIPVSVNLSGTSMGNGASTLASISSDGRYVVFESLATDLVTNVDQNAGTDIFVRDLVTGTTTLASVTESGEAGGGSAAPGSPNGLAGVPGPLISGDGRYVLFTSKGAGVTVRDLQLNQSTAIGSLTGTSPRYRFATDNHRLLVSSFVGRKDYAIALPSFSVSVIFTHPNNIRQDTVFSGDGTVEVINNYTNLWLISIASSNLTLVAQALPTPGLTRIPYPNEHVGFDDSGRFLVYSDVLFHNKVGSPPNNFSDIFLYHASTQTNLLLSRMVDPADGPAVTPKISANGRIVVFQSGALNLGVRNSSTVGADIYVYRTSAANAPDSFRASILESLNTGQFVISWESIPGASYRIEFKSNLLSTSWNVLEPDLVASDTVSSVNDPNGSPERYYRIQKLP